MKFFLKNKILFGDSCSGKTFLYKKIFSKKIDIDFFINYKKIFFKYEYFYRKIEKKFLFILNFIKKKYFFLGGGCIQFTKKKYFLIYKNNSIKDQKKRLLIDNNNRPTLYNNNYLKIRFCIRKKIYIKISNIYIKKCNKCNIYLL